MALSTTTNSSAITVTDTSIVVASAAGFAAGNLVLIDSEYLRVAKNYTSGTTIPVLRGQEGTVTAAHNVTSNVTTSATVTDFAVIASGVEDAWTGGPRPRISQYSASGAISFGAWMDIAILVGTSTLTMTVAAPTKDQDGCLLLISGNAKSASTVAIGGGTVGIGNAGSSYDTMTAQTGGNVAMLLVACNGFWNLVNAPITGTTTALSWGIS